MTASAATDNLWILLPRLEEAFGHERPGYRVKNGRIDSLEISTWLGGQE